MLDKQRLRSFLLGGLAGVLAGVLLAPKSGKETRGSVRNRAGEARERSRETYFDAQERLREKVSATRSATREGAYRHPGETVPSPPEPESSTEDVHERPVLRDVSRDAPTDGGGEEVSSSEELRRKVRQTRERLRAKMDGPAENGPRGGGSGGEE